MARGTNSKRLLVAWSVLLAGACGHGGPTTPIHEVICRALPTRLFWIDETFDCQRSMGPASPFELSCSGGQRTLTTTYPNISAVTAEKLVPNRTYVVRRTFGGCGSFATLGCATSTFSYEYDAGRLRRRRLTFSQTLSSGVVELQTVDFVAWDLQGRPTRAMVQERGLETDVTIAYDDARRTESWSNGEQRVRDADANIIHEVTTGRDETGKPLLSATDFAIEATEPVCTDPPGPPASGLDRPAAASLEDEASPLAWAVIRESCHIQFGTFAAGLGIFDWNAFANGCGPVAFSGDLKPGSVVHAKLKGQAEAYPNKDGGKNVYTWDADVTVIPRAKP